MIYFFLVFWKICTYDFLSDYSLYGPEYMCSLCHLLKLIYHEVLFLLLTIFRMWFSGCFHCLITSKQKQCSFIKSRFENIKFPNLIIFFQLVWKVTSQVCMWSFSNIWDCLLVFIPLNLEDYGKLIIKHEIIKRIFIKSLISKIKKKFERFLKFRKFYPLASFLWIQFW